MGLLTTILGILFFGCFAIWVFVTEATTNRIALVIAGVAAAIIAIQLLVEIL